MAKPDCALDSGTLCAPVWRLTHQSWLARAVDTTTAHAARIVVIVVIALVVRWLLHRTITRLTRTTAETRIPVALRPLKERAVSHLRDEGTPLLSERRRQRAETIGSIMRSIASFVTFTVAFILVLGELGIDLAPIIASAGIAGVAFGFGAQNLVKDFLSGMFMILEDQFGVGDVVDAGQASGTVEAVGLRTTRLRDERGTVWYVRNGEIVRIGNRTQGFGKLILDISVAPGTDTDRASTLLEDVADALWQDEAWKSSVLEEPAVLGVQDITSTGTVLRLQVKTHPGAQDTVGRELRARIAARFAAEGLQAPVAATAS